MKSRAFLGAGVIGVALLTGVASAAPAPVCQILKDAKGDAKYNNVPGDSSVDITSADVASDGRTITGVIRLDKLVVPNPQAPLGQAWFVKFNAKGAADVLFLAARSYPTGNQFIVGYNGVDPTLGVLSTSYPIANATGVIDLAKNEVRISAPVSAFAPTGAKITNGSKLSGVSADAWRMVGQGVVPSQNVGPTRAPIGGVSLPYDTAEGGSYTVGARSCVVLGK